MSYPLSFSIAAIACFFALRLFHPLAFKMRLVDRPNERKLHQGEIPLIGGPAMFVAFLCALLVFSTGIDQLYGFIIATSLIVLIGILDDHRHISVRWRFLLQAVAVMIMTLVSSVIVKDLGYLLGNDAYELYYLSIPFTIIAAVGAMNATNMIDGMDGLAGSTALICFLGVLYLYYFNEKIDHGEVIIKPILFVAVLLPFILCNVSKKQKIFMGDSGSMFLGFGVAWVLTEATQGEHAVMAPVTALWLFAIPLIDMWAIMYRRVMKGQSPFLADRDHLHHIFQRAGYSDRSTVMIMSILAVICASIGVFGHINMVPEWIMFAGFIVFLVLYIWGIQHAWILLKKIRRQSVSEKT